MTLAELQSDLAEVQATITKILGSNTQEFWVGGTDRHRAPELARLFDERRRLRDEIAAISGSDAVFSHISVIG
jgi:phage replication-related protein YjqB (UPF0714/DUF867 family)